MNSGIRLFLSGLIIAAIALGGFFACKKIKTHETPAPLQQSLDSVFTSVFRLPDAPGAIVMITKDDSLVYKRSFGMAALDKPLKMTDSTLLNICSISKQFSAVALLKLEELELLSLDDTVKKYFPQYKSGIFNKIALSNLLSHTSGLPDNRPYTEDDWKEYSKIHQSCFNNISDFCHYCPWQESCAFYENLDTLKFEPGTAYDYQNPTYQLVLPIVESVTGKNFDLWMKENIFMPAGMTETYYVQQGRIIPRMVHAYRLADSTRHTNAYISENGRWEEFDYGEANYFTTKADGGIYTSARDFLKWQHALFSGKIISEEALYQAIQPHITTDIPDTGYGYGFFIEEKPEMPRKIFHTGDNGAFCTYAATIPEKGINYIIFANRNDWNREATVAATDSVLRANRIL